MNECEGCGAYAGAEAASREGRCARCFAAAREDAHSESAAADPHTPAHRA